MLSYSKYIWVINSLFFNISFYSFFLSLFNILFIEHLLLFLVGFPFFIRNNWISGREINNGVNYLVIILFIWLLLAISTVFSIEIVNFSRVYHKFFFWLASHPALIYLIKLRKYFQHICFNCFELRRVTNIRFDKVSIKI